MTTNELRNKIVLLEQLLKERNCKTSIFFKGLIDKLEKGCVSDVIDSIIHSYALTQYADFNYKEENLFSDILEIASQLNSFRRN